MESQEFLTEYKAISNKLKKRFLRRPNVAEASDNFRWDEWQLAAVTEISYDSRPSVLQWLKLAGGHLMLLGAIFFHKCNFLKSISWWEEESLMSDHVRAIQYSFHILPTYILL